MKKLQVVVTKDSKYALSDWDVEKWFQELLVSGDVAYVASANMLNEVRLGVRLGEIEPCSFEFEGQTINILPTGELDHWPNGLGDHVMIQMDAMIFGISREEARAIQYKHNNESDRRTDLML